MNRILFLLILVSLSFAATGQVDTAFIYNESTPYGVLDLRLKKSESDYYYVDEGKTFSFRTENGQRTNTFLSLNAWDTDPYQQGELREKLPSTDRFIMNYRLLLPANFQKDKKYPIVLFLHGLFETGNCSETECIHADRDYDPNDNIPEAPEDPDFPLYNNDYNLLNGGRNYLNARNRAGDKLVGDPTLATNAFPGFVLFPQSNNEWSPYEVENAIRLVRLIVKKYNIDLNRIYINGLSRGGYGAFEAMKRAPWLFAAGALFSPISDANINSQNLASTVQHIPLWIFQGGQDTQPSPKSTEDRINKFRNAGMSVKYTLYPQLGHATWNEALEEPDFFKWLLGYTNNRIHAFGGGDAICQSQDAAGLRLTLPPGFKEYEWQLNGNTIKAGSENYIVVEELGDYRARFKYYGSDQWNDWSKEIGIGMTSPEPAVFKQQGTLHLPDLNGKNEAVLEAVGNFNHYDWYRYETRIDFPGDADDTLRIATIPSSLGSGYFSLRVGMYDGCYSPPSIERKIFFNSKSPLSITAPNAFTAQAMSSSEILLSWKDRSDDEEGFEIWRRLISGGNSSTWTMAGITVNNEQTFTDSNLRPSSKYEYKIRAVSNLGRSDYFPGSGSELYAETSPDNTPPQKPFNLTADLVDVNTIKVRWNAAEDDSFIEEYQLFVNEQMIRTGNSDTTYWLRDLETNTSYTIQVAAVDAGKNISEKSDAVTVSTQMTGLFYKHTTGAWQDLKNIDWSRWEYEGRVRDFDLSPKRQEDFFNFRYDGFLLIENGGDYQFRVASNDGSRLRLNDTLVVENDGVHNMKPVTSAVRHVGSGPQRIRVDFFDYMNADSLQVEYIGPDTNEEWKTIGREVLKSSSEAGREKLELAVYPNPASHGTTNVVVRGGNGDPLLVTICTALGKKIKEYYFDEIGLSILPLDGLDMESGVYLITVTQNKNSSGKRLVIAR
jgi:hypothetical protein